MGVILFKNLVYFCPRCPLIKESLQHGHASLYIDHVSCHKTYRNVSKFYWLKMKSNIEQFVAECHTCQHNNVEIIRYLGIIQPNVIPN
jgi:hypothetical protein